MGFWRKVLEFFEVVKPTAVEFGSDPMTVADVRQVQAALRDRIGLCRQLEIQRNCYQEELLRRGETPKTLKAMVAMYENKLRVEARVRRPA